MPNPTSIVLTDGTTPVTLYPSVKDGEVSQFRSTSAASLAAQSKLKVSSKVSDSAQRVFSRLDEPLTYVDADSGLTVVHEHALAEMNFRIPAGMTAAERTAFVKRAFNQGAETTLQAVFEDGEGIW